MGYDTVARIFHWLTVGIVAVMIPVGLIMTQEIERGWQDRLFILHKGLGGTFLFVIAARLIWRATHRAPALPATVPNWQARAAYATHIGLYLLLVVMAVSGYVRVTTGGFPIELFDMFGIPPLFGKDKAVSDFASGVHEITKSVLILLILLHVAAAVFHGAVKRDGVFSRMWPPISP